MKKENIKMNWNEQEILEAGGCIMIWIGKKEGSRSFVKENAWEDLSRVVINKKIHNVQWIKRIQEKTCYDGTRTLTSYEENGKRIFIYKS